MRRGSGKKNPEQTVTQNLLFDPDKVAINAASGRDPAVSQSTFRGALLGCFVERSLFNYRTNRPWSSAPAAYRANAGQHLTAIRQHQLD